MTVSLEQLETANALQAMQDPSGVDGVKILVRSGLQELRGR